MPARVLRAAVCAALGLVVLATTAPSGIAQTAPTATPAPAAAAPTATPPSAPAVSPTATSTPVPTVFSSGVPCATDDPSAPGGVQRSERHGTDVDSAQGRGDEFSTGNGHNEVIVHNCTDNRLRVAASIQLNTIPGHVVAPLNVAYAEGSCSQCQTLAVALQIDLYNPERANDVQPENFAVAINTNCSHCFTVARAIQYVQPVDDPMDVAEEIQSAVQAMDDELRAVQTDPNVSLLQAEARLNAVLQRFLALGGSLGEQRDEKSD